MHDCTNRKPKSRGIMEGIFISITTVQERERDRVGEEFCKRRRRGDNSGCVKRL